MMPSYRSCEWADQDLQYCKRIAFLERELERRVEECERLRKMMQPPSGFYGVNSSGRNVPAYKGYNPVGLMGEEYKRAFKLYGGVNEAFR